MRKHLLALFLILVCSPAFSAWDKNKPTLDDYLYDWPAQVQANWDAIETGTDPALLITNAKVSATASIADTKLASITTAGKVSGTAITGLASLPGGAGAVPIANGGTGQTTRQGALDALLDTQTGNSGKALVTNGTNGSWGYPASLTVASATQGDVLYYNGTAWTRLAPGTADYALVSNGAGATPAYEQVNLATAVQGTLPIARGGTGQTSAANAINALLPSQTGNSGKYLTTNGSAASWGSVVQNTFKSASGIVELQNTTSISGLGFTPVTVNIFFSGPPAGTSGLFVLSSVSKTSYTISPLGTQSPRTGVLTIKNKVSGGFDIDIQLSGSNGSILHRCYWVAYNE